MDVQAAVMIFVDLSAGRLLEEIKKKATYFVPDLFHLRNTAITFGSQESG